MVLQRMRSIAACDRLSRRPSQTESGSETPSRPKPFLFRLRRRLLKNNKLNETFRFVTEYGYKAVFPEEDILDQVRDRVGV